MTNLARAGAVCALALGLFAATACEDEVTQPATIATTSFTVAPGGVAFEFEPLASSAVCRDPDAPGYVPFDLPAGFEQEIIASELDDFEPVAGAAGDLPDMITLNETGPHAGSLLYRTHEVGSNGAVTMTDLRTGVTSLVVQQPHYERLDGIAWTPWGTLLFAEETGEAALPDPDFPSAIRGLVYEYDPRTGAAVPRPAVGSRSHEGVRLDPQGNVYGIAESRGRSRAGEPGRSGAIFRFVVAARSPSRSRSSPRWAIATRSPAVSTSIATAGSCGSTCSTRAAAGTTWP